MKEKLILVGRVMDGNRLVGGKFISLYTLSSIYVKRVEFTAIFKNYDVLNCKYDGNILRSKQNNLMLKSLSVYSSSFRLIKSGVPESYLILEYGALISGAIVDPDGFEALKHAEMYYDEIRSMKTDVQKIAKNLNMSINDISRIKNYLFIDVHELYSGKKRFDANFHIAQSWQRLMSKNSSDIQPHDITLINHELLEMSLICSGMTQNEAHHYAENTYNYRKESDEYYDKIKKNKKRR